jgi:thiol-disulfide isomerase/thioredoxin
MRGWLANVFVMAAVLGLAASACSAADPNGGAPPIARVGSPAPKVVLPMLSGGTFDLSQQRGSVVLLNFWATWCEPCKAEMPALQRLAQDLASQPFRLYTVNLQEDAPPIQAFMDSLGLRVPVLLDQDGDVTRSYGARALPATYLIDRNGVVRQQRLGPILEGDASKVWTRDWLDGQVRSLLAS